MIQIISYEKLKEIEKNPFLDVNKGKYAVLNKEKDIYICLDNRSGKPHKRTCTGIIEVVKWFNGMLTIDNQSIESSDVSYKFQPGEAGVMHRKYGPCSIINRSLWNGIKFYEIRVHGTTSKILVTEHQLQKEQHHGH